MNLIKTLFFILFSFPGILPVAGSNDVLNLVGSGEVDYLGFIKVYDAALYAPDGATAEKIQQAGCSYCLKLKYQVDLSANTFIQAAEKTLAQQWPEEKISMLRPRIDQLHRAYRDVRKKDSYSLCYEDTNKVMTLALNDNILTTVYGREFAELYAGIWLGKQHPISLSLQKSLFAKLPQR